MRKYLPETELREIAERLSQEITIRDYDGGNSVDTKRKTTKPERAVLKEILNGALLVLNLYSQSNVNYDWERIVLDTAEYIGIRMMPEVNTYDSIYLPLLKILHEWERDE